MNEFIVIRPVEVNGSIIARAAEVNESIIIIIRTVEINESIITIRMAEVNRKHRYQYDGSRIEIRHQANGDFIELLEYEA